MNKLRMLFIPLAILSTIAVCVARFMIPSHPVSLNGTIEVFMHIWVGVMLAKHFASADTLDQVIERFICVDLLVIATVSEVVMFMIFKTGN